MDAKVINIASPGGVYSLMCYESLAIVRKDHNDAKYRLCILTNVVLLFKTVVRCTDVVVKRVGHAERPACS